MARGVAQLWLDAALVGGRGRCGAHAGDQIQRLLERVAPLHELENHIIPGLQRQVQIGHKARLLAHTTQEVGIDLGGINGGEAKARQVRYQL